MQTNEFNDFRIITASSALLLIAILAFALGDAAHKESIWRQTEAAKDLMQAQASIQKAQLQTSKEIAQVRAENYVTVPPPALKLIDYTFHNDPPELGFLDLVDPNQKTLIYDQFENCIGSAYQGQFIFLKNDRRACEV